jgi:hypothetical protein
LFKTPDDVVKTSLFRVEEAARYPPPYALRLAMVGINA